MKVVKSKLLQLFVMSLIAVFGIAVVYQQFFSLAKHGDAEWGGTVTVVDVHVLTVVDLKGVTRTFTVTPETKVVSGRQEIPLLQVPVGTFVLVRTNQEDSTQATDIQVLADGN